MIPPKLKECDLPHLWFTGEEWSNGTAARLLEQQYIDEERKLIRGEYIQKDLQMDNK